MRAAGGARVLAIAALLALMAMPASARPGGGHSYSGSSSHSSSGGHGSGSSRGNFIFDLLEWVRGRLGWGPIPFYGLAFGVVFLLANREKSKQPSMDIGGRSPAENAMTRVRDDLLVQVRKHDPDFSLVLFEDFAYALYAESQRARHDARAFAGLAPYWTKEAQASLTARPPEHGRVQAAVVGALGPERFFEEARCLTIVYAFESNLHIELEAAPSGTVSSFLVGAGLATVSTDTKPMMTQYVRESWTFSRALEARTRPWTGVRKLGCPSCGAPLSAGGDARCPSCGEESGDGRFDWQVTAVTVHSVEDRKPSFTGTSEEVGTNAETVFAPLVGPQLEDFQRADPGVSTQLIEARLGLIFDTLQSSWGAQDLGPLRPFVSDRQFDSLQYWIGAYKAQGLRNLVDGPRLEKFVFVRVERDTSYDALTLRIWGSGCDYTIDTKSGRVVGGSRTTARRYSEYWTLVRSAKVRGTPRLDRNCPGCGASLDLNMAGECEHCGAHVTSGEFDWVLSKIEQDEAFRG